MQSRFLLETAFLFVIRKEEEKETEK